MWEENHNLWITGMFLTPVIDVTPLTLVIPNLGPATWNHKILSLRTGSVFFVLFFNCSPHVKILSLISAAKPHIKWCQSFTDFTSKWKKPPWRQSPTVVCEPEVTEVMWDGWVLNYQLQYTLANLPFGKLSAVFVQHTCS